jgi:nicotinamide-nucleotide amidase
LNLELINTGSELMLGRVLNTHQQWLCRQLTALGYEVARQVTVGDTALAIQAAVCAALAEADVIIVTGGLGPTADDRTREVIAALLGRRLVLDGTVLAAIERFYAARGRPVLESTKAQAMVPEGGIVLPNSVGTAPGLIIEAAPNPWRPAQRPSLLVMLPGPPRELYPMFAAQVAPLLQKKFPPESVYASRVLKTTGLGESMIEERIAGALASLTKNGLDLGYCARVGEVEIRLSARGSAAQEMVGQAAQIVCDRLGPCIFATNDESLETVVVRLLTERRQTLAIAESCTGGYIAHRITNVSGASAVFLGGWVTYSNEAKQRFLGVPEEIIAAHGAVSEPTARAMAEGARRQQGADYALAVTGIAGPTGGTTAKPVGTVYIALATAEGIRLQHQVNHFDRENFKQATAQQALELLRQTLISSYK